MKSKLFITFALAVALPAGALLAQSQNDGPPDGGPGPGPGGRNHRPPPMPIVQALDTNHDGIISAEEIANAPAALKKLDKNGDGQLTKDEYMPPHPRRHGDGSSTNTPPDGPPPDANGSGQTPPPRLVPPIVAALDTNGDGIISADEIANASASLLKLDKNGDGKLTRDEYMPPRPPHGDGPGPNGPGNDQLPPPPEENQ